MNGTPSIKLNPQRPPIKVSFKRRVLGGKPLVKRVGRDIVISPDLLRKFGHELLRAIRFEGRKELAQQGNAKVPVGEPEGIPLSPRFWRSFTFRIVGKSTIEVLCRWPWGKLIIEGKDEYKMGWLTRERGVTFIPMRQKDGKVVVRMTPMRAVDAWVHPGFAAHKFVEKGVEKARTKIVQMLANEVVPIGFEVK